MQSRSPHQIWFFVVKFQNPIFGLIIEGPPFRCVVKFGEQQLAAAAAAAAAAAVGQSSLSLGTKDNCEAVMRRFDLKSHK